MIGIPAMYSSWPSVLSFAVNSSTNLMNKLNKVFRCVRHPVIIWIAFFTQLTFYIVNIQAKRFSFFIFLCCNNRNWSTLCWRLQMDFCLWQIVKRVKLCMSRTLLHLCWVRYVHFIDLFTEVEVSGESQISFSDSPAVFYLSLDFLITGSFWLERAFALRARSSGRCRKSTRTTQHFWFTKCRYIYILIYMRLSLTFYFNNFVQI